MIRDEIKKVIDNTDIDVGTQAAADKLTDQLVAAIEADFNAQVEAALGELDAAVHAAMTAYRTARDQNIGEDAWRAAVREARA